MALNGQRVTDLFEPTLSDHNNRCLSSADVPLAERLRPTALSDVLGQDHLLGPNAPLGRMLAAGRLSSIVFWGGPGTGKTSIARLLPDATGLRCKPLPAFPPIVSDLQSVFANDKI